MQVSSRRKRARRTRPSATSGNGGGRIRVQSRAASKAGPRQPTPAPPASGKQAQVNTEMARSDPQFKAALKFFSAAARYFQKQDYEKAQELFEKVAASAARELAERARVHLVLCGQKLGRPAPAPKTASEYYDLGVAKLNARDLGQAIDFLNKADKADPDREHIQYALAATHAIQGNIDAALEHLKGAIALRSGNRYQARYDDDFQSLASDPRFQRLVSPGDGQNS
jgi:tetratricopeptide (TPR) repeat protein